uniref:Uncharacterized protein n=1 Tax=Arundo donax TaxID=35708 RepID=A0A0A9CPK2_ARUDO
MANRGPPWTFQGQWYQLCEDCSKFCCEVFLATSRHQREFYGFTVDRLGMRKLSLLHSCALELEPVLVS